MRNGNHRYKRYRSTIHLVTKVLHVSTASFRNCNSRFFPLSIPSKRNQCSSSFIDPPQRCPSISLFDRHQISHSVSFLDAGVRNNTIINYCRCSIVLLFLVMSIFFFFLLTTSLLTQLQSVHQRTLPSVLS